MKAYSCIRTQRQQEAMDIVQEVKASKPSDPTVAKYLVYVLNDLG
jgi:hypothetical protein